MKTTLQLAIGTIGVLSTSSIVIIACIIAGIITLRKS